MQVLCFAIIGAASSESIVYRDGGNGSVAVLLALDRIEQSEVLDTGSDNGILRRIAYVETRDGTLPDTFRDGYNGGIWAVDEDKFISTKNTTMLDQIEENLHIDWLNVEWRELRKPLYSALAAWLVLLEAPVAVPPASDLAAQAEFWAENYNRDGNVSNFISICNSTDLEGSIKYSSVH